MNAPSYVLNIMADEAETDWDAIENDYRADLTLATWESYPNYVRMLDEEDEDR